MRRESLQDLIAAVDDLNHSVVRVIHEVRNVEATLERNYSILHDHLVDITDVLESLYRGMSDDEKTSQDNAAPENTETEKEE